MDKKIYLGSVLLNGPIGAPDTSEIFTPKELVGIPTVMALVFETKNTEAARNRQIIWHLLRDRLFSLKREKPCDCYKETAKISIQRLEVLAESIINGTEIL